MGLNLLTMIIGFSTKRVYNNIPMLNHWEVKVFSKKQVLLNVFPIVIVIPFIVVEFLRYSFFISVAYVALTVLNRPMDAFDKARRRL